MRDHPNGAQTQLFTGVGHACLFLRPGRLPAGQSFLRERGMLNCKPGDLAVIVTSPNAPENVGKIVQVIRPAVHGEMIEGWRVGYKPGLFAWVVKSAGSKLAWYNYPGPDGTSGKNEVYIRPYADYCLRPIRDPEHDEEEKASRDLTLEKV